MKNLETNWKPLMANRRNTRRSEHCIWNLFLQLQRTQTKSVKFIWHSRLWAQRVKTLQETSHSRTKENPFLVIQIQQALWRKLNNLKPISSLNKEPEVFIRGPILPTRNKPQRKLICVSGPLSVKQAAKITFVKSKLRNLQSIIYSPEGKNLLEQAPSF